MWNAYEKWAGLNEKLKMSLFKLLKAVLTTQLHLAQEIYCLQIITPPLLFDRYKKTPTHTTMQVLLRCSFFYMKNLTQQSKHNVLNTSKQLEILTIIR